MGLLLEAKDAEDWGYRGEGAANVVMFYCGTSSDFAGRVLRLQKVGSEIPDDGSSRKSAQILSTEEQLLWADWEQLVAATSKEILTQAYAQHVIAPILGFEHVDPGTLVSVSKEFLEALEKNISNQRPAWRIRSSKINLQSGFALLMSDHSMFSQGLDRAAPCVSIEIKPKCGVLPSSKFLSAENHLKRLVSRFAMHQHLKFSQEKVPCISKYSPLDLFSESWDRMDRAIGGLFETPQNNLRIFLNGSLVFGGVGGYAEEGIHNGSITESVLEDVLMNVISCQKGERVGFFKDLIIEALLETGTLSRLISLQEKDLHDIEGAIHAYFNIIKEPCQICHCDPYSGGNINTAEDDMVMLDETMEKPTNYNDPYLYSLSSENGSKQDDRIQNQRHEYFTYLHSLPIEESRKIVRNYLLATTAKDCSLMLTFQPVNHDDVNLLDRNDILYLKATNQAFQYKVRYVDLDLKRLKNMIHYYSLDQEIVKFYTRIHGANKSC